LHGNGIALGVDPHFRFETYQRTGLAEGQIIVLNTDGVWEAHDSNGESFGKQRLYETIRRNAQQNAKGIIASILTAVHRFKGGAETEDDITIVVIKSEQIGARGNSGA